MLKLVGRISRNIGGKVPFDSEVRLEPHLRGVIVKSLPDNIPYATLKKYLEDQLKSPLVDLKKDIIGKPAYAIVKFAEETEMEAALKLNKTEIGGRRVHICVSPI